MSEQTGFRFAKMHGRGSQNQLLAPGLAKAAASEAQVVARDFRIQVSKGGERGSGGNNCGPTAPRSGPKCMGGIVKINFWRLGWPRQPPARPRWPPEAVEFRFLGEVRWGNGCGPKAANGPHRPPTASSSPLGGPKCIGGVVKISFWRLGWPRQPPARPEFRFLAALGGEPPAFPTPPIASNGILLPLGWAKMHGMCSKNQLLASGLAKAAASEAQMAARGCRIQISGGERGGGRVRRGNGCGPKAANGSQRPATASSCPLGEPKCIGGMVKNQLLASGLAKAAASEAQVAARGFRIQISERGSGGTPAVQRAPGGRRKPPMASSLPWVSQNAWEGAPVALSRGSAAVASAI